MGNLFTLIRKKIYKTQREKLFDSFSKEEKSLRYHYDLNENSLVFDVGGYEGQWSSDIFSMYCCKIFCFEPVSLYAKNISLRYQQNPKISIFPFGLGRRNETTYISVNKDSSSVFKNNNCTEKINIIQISEFLKERNIDNIDLIKINIEGGEYDLLEDLLVSDYIRKLRNIQVQFHDFVKNAKERMNKLQAEISKTHYLTYQFEFIWENWKLKE